MNHLKDVRAWATSPDTPVREVLSRFNELLYPLHIVIDEKGRLLGTVTDGDIRRAFLEGATLDDPISRCMHRDPITGHVGEDVGNAELLRAINFLPLLDEDGVVVEILILQPVPPVIQTCLIMAGGLGTRLGDKTQTLPKPLLPVGDKPILGHILSRLEEAKVLEIFISVHYMADKIEAFIANRDNRSTIRLVHENSRLGTAGALSLLPQPIEHPVLVVNGDVVSRVDFPALREFHERHGYDATLAVARYEVEIPFGVVRQSRDGLFEGIDEKPRNHQFVAAGIYCLSPEFCALVPPDRPTDMPDLLNLGRNAGLRVGLFPIHEYWIDVGRPDDLETAVKEHGESS